MDEKTAIPVIFNIHVEPNERLIPFRKKRWNGYEDLHQYLSQKRAEFQNVTGNSVNFNWLFRLDYQIAHVYGRADWGLHEYKDLVQASHEAGDSFGVHIHSWRPHKTFFRKSWLADFSDPEWLEYCVKLSHQSYVDFFQKSPKYFSFGDHYMNDRVLRQLFELGYRCDATMYPGRPAIKRFVKNELSEGILPSFTEVPRYPFKVNIDPDKKCKLKKYIWEVPVSVASKKDSAKNYPEKLLLGIPHHKIPQMVQDNLELPFPYLLAEMRTDVRLDRFNREQFDRTIEYFIQHPMASNMRFMTVDKFLDFLEKKEHSKSFSCELPQ